jgi:D-2-hydroxyacid dehydrogenase (NADP+)
MASRARVLLYLTHEVSAFQPTPEQLAALNASHPALELVRCDTLEAFLEALPSADASLVWHFESAWYAQATRLQMVATPAAGRERVAPDPDGRVRVVHGAFHGRIMAETLVAMVAYFARRLDLADVQQRERRFERDGFSRTRPLSHQTALIVGYGPLGRHCAASLKSLGLRVLGVKRNYTVDPAPAEAVFPVSELYALLAQADHIVVTLPSDTGTDRLFDERAFAAMKPGAHFYNLGRGNAVDEAALVSALERRTIAGAFLDVFAREPLPPTSPLWDAPGLRIMPHASAIRADYLDLWFAELYGELERLANR